MAASCGMFRAPQRAFDSEGSDVALLPLIRKLDKESRTKWKARAATLRGYPVFALVGTRLKHLGSCGSTNISRSVHRALAALGSGWGARGEWLETERGGVGNQEPSNVDIHSPFRPDLLPKYSPKDPQSPKSRPQEPSVRTY